jgi:hypothetical protein
MAESVADLESLYNVEATFEYTSRNGLMQALHAFLDRTFIDRAAFLQDRTVLVTRFPPQMFEIESNVDNPVIPGRKVLYLPESQVLISTMAGTCHEIVSRKIEYLLQEKISKMGCEHALRAVGQTREHLQNLNKEPDGSWGPQAVRYPTCVLEIGMSESLRQLDRDAQRWIENEISHVTQVITVKIYPRRHEIIFTTWNRTARRRAEKNNEIHVELREGRPRVRNNKRLRLSFDQIFERPPTPGTAERDVIFSAREIGGIARRVWLDMGLIP